MGMNGWNYGFAALLTLALVTTPLTGRADDEGDDADETDEEPLEVAQLFLELNHTDGDLGIQGLIDHDEWIHLEIDRPNDFQMLGANVFGRAARHGMTELFFESAEPGFDDLSPADFFVRFPAGIYDIEVMQRDGTEFESEVELSHVLPAPAGNVTVGGAAAAEDCDAELPVTGLTDVLIAWDPVTTSHPDLGVAGPVAIDNYQFVVEIEDEANDQTWVMSVKLPATVTQFLVPASYIALAPEGEVKFEVGAQSDTLNRTVVESCFSTGAGDGEGEDEDEEDDEQDNEGNGA
jgi:hypothetical protein